MKSDNLTAGNKQVSVKIWPVNTEAKDSAMVGGVANGKPTSRTAPKGKS